MAKDVTYVLAKTSREKLPFHRTEPFPFLRLARRRILSHTQRDAWFLVRDAMILQIDEADIVDIL